eukprot:TRINITY_DN40156_c0_g1_i1.p1 TRINITY_DN40156_c0_g1~~TRINITY_DN40156_c0_g1_i1.p1  ORF type:complete len:624 (-),score=85.21 TRINITY_DN40156_c0_g1_i1:65-1936(-)
MNGERGTRCSAGPNLDFLLDGKDVERASPVHFRAVGVSYAVPGTKRRDAPRKVLAGIDCDFPPGKLSAVMGASGSGKTSLITLFRGLSAKGSTLVGDVLCNDSHVSFNRMRSLVSVVPQEDVFLSALTPREMLSFSAELRLPMETEAFVRCKHVETMISFLRLESCADTLIGNEATAPRGISGGERRRLSVGLAIIGGLPSALLCDEPTSGLDSAAAAVMVSLLKGISDRGSTVLCAIHQPSYSIFKEFNYLVLMHGGETVYAGAIDHVEDYFKSAGSPTPPHTNPAHHYVEEMQRPNSSWARRWQENGCASLARGEKAQAIPGSVFRDHGKSQLSLRRQTSVLVRRMLLENFKNRSKFFRGLMVRLPAAIAVGLFFGRVAAVPLQTMIFPLRGVLFVASQNPLIETFYAGATTFQSTRGLLRREYYDGLYQVAPFYIAYYVSFLAMQIPWTLAWAIPIYVLTGFPLEPARFMVFILTTFLMTFGACAGGSAVGARTKDQQGNRAVLVPLIIPMILFSGYVIPYKQLMLTWVPLYYLSPVQWAISILEMSLYQGVVFLDCDASVPLSLRQCYATGEEYIADIANPVARSIGIPGMMMICVAYVIFFMSLNVRTIHRYVLDGRV